MSSADVAERFSERAGFDLIAFADVGLPFWRLRTRCEVLAHKQISPIDEFIMRAVHHGVEDAADLMIFLGLDEPVLDASIVSMLSAGWLRQTGSARLALTDAGTEVMLAAVQERAEERMIPFEYDGLLRKPALLELPLEPHQLAASGAREIPAFPTDRPDLSEVAERRGDIERLIRSLGDGRDQEMDLLAVKEIIRRERIFRDAIALLFRASDGTELQVSFAVDETLSEGHEQAFARAQLIKRLGIARGVRSRIRHPELLPDAARAEYDADAENRARAAIRIAASAVAAAHDEQGSAAAHRALRAARRRLRQLSVRAVECYEHPGLLDLLLRSARKELLIASPRVTAAVLDRDLIQALRRTLKRGTRVRIAYGISRNPADGLDASALERLQGLARDHPALEIRHFGTLKRSGLIRDGGPGIITHFPLLSHRGDATRPLGDERGWLLTGGDLVETELARLNEAWERAASRDLRSPEDKVPQHSRGSPREKRGRSAPRRRQRSASRDRRIDGDAGSARS